MNSQQQDAVRASITETISERDIAKLFYALDNFDQDLIPILAKLERVAVAGDLLAKAVERLQIEFKANICECGEGWKGTDADNICDAALTAYRSAIEKNV